eukprot:s2112_g29.t1
MPRNVPGLVPSVWRKSDEDGARPGEGEYECRGLGMNELTISSWIPLRLEYAPEEYQKALEEDSHGSVVRCCASHGISPKILKDRAGICDTFCFILFATPSPNPWSLEEAAAEAGRDR